LQEQEGLPAAERQVVRPELEKAPGGSQAGDRKLGPRSPCEDERRSERDMRHELRDHVEAIARAEVLDAVKDENDGFLGGVESLR
jgi:hypothetical protein